jgi:alanine racemase
MKSEQTQSGAVLTIDLKALASNYRLLARRSGAAVCAAAIKGEAYGIGLEQSAKTLWNADCRDYFVARPQEGAILRKILPKAAIYILDGLYPDQAALYLKHSLVPCLGTTAQVKDWAANGKSRPCALHVDTGINRLGLSASEFTKVAGDTKLNYKLNIALLMSHFACSDDVNSAMNAMQLQRFKQAHALYPHLRASLANSSGIFLGRTYAFDMTRPGIALYGGNPTPHAKNPMKPVAHLHLRVLQVRTVPKGETVGYSATWQALRDSRIAVLAAGYRDGIPRKLSSSNANDPAQVWLGGKHCPIVGRVSMDMMCVDVTDAPRVRADDFAELFGKHISVDEVASWAGTISYELLTHLGNRYERVYKPAAS